MPNPSAAIIEDEGVRRTVSPTVDVMPQRNRWTSRYGRIDHLPSPLDFGGAPWNLPSDLKWAMLRDSQVFAGYMMWKTAVLVDGIQIYPSSKIKKGEPRFELAREISEFCLHGLNGMRGGFHSKLLQLLDCCVQGEKAAVHVARLETKGRWAGKMVPDYWRILPNNSYRIRTDQFGMVKGLQSADAQGEAEIYPISKFLHCVFRPYDDHPLGTNILWPAYMPWYEKQQIAPERMAHMAQFGSPSFVGTAPEGITHIPLVDQFGMPIMRDGRPVEIPINEHMTQALANFQGNGSAIVVPYGGKIDKIEAANGGEIFRLYSDDKNLEIIKAMFFTAGWSENTKNPSSAQSKAGEGIGQFSIQDGKYMLADAIEEYLYTLTVINYGEENADLAPDVTLGSPKRSIMTSLANSIAALWSTGFFDNTQREQLCKDLGLPEPDPNEPTVNPNTTNKATGNVKVKGNDNKEEEDEDDESDN